MTESNATKGVNMRELLGLDIKTILLIAALFGSNGLQAVGISIPSQTRTASAQDRLFASQSRVDELQGMLERCQERLDHCESGR